MNKVTIISLAAIFSFSANSAYISTTSYKNHSCDELKEDRAGHLADGYKKDKELMKLSIDNITGGNLSEKIKIISLEKEVELSNAHVEAISRAGKKLQCGDLR